ncbi:MAG: phenylalanine 4-monooxygenase [Betaproteobacteria bacterium]|nr:phenylalanine 4-monooxygenase [Betaproteobacteria bacterium]
MAVQPVTYGQSTRAPRGDYSSARDDYTCAQPVGAYTAAEHDRWRRLYDSRVRGLPGLAADEYLQALSRLDARETVPSLDRASEALYRATRWQLVAVPGLIPEQAFFALLAARKFPVTWWLREEHEFDYIVEPDVFHDFFGHVPLLFDPMFADYMQAYGEGGLKADRLNALQYLARLYWYTVEFGLIATPQGLRVYGAGILSSGSEPRHSVLDPRPKRVAFDLLRVMRSAYKIDDFQATYFVIDSYAQLFRETAPDFTPLYQRLAQMPDIAAGAVLPSDRLYPANA